MLLSCFSLLVTSIGLVNRNHLSSDWVMAQFGGQKNPPWATQFAATAVSQPGHSGQSLDLNSLHCEFTFLCCWLFWLFFIYKSMLIFSYILWVLLFSLYLNPQKHIPTNWYQRKLEMCQKPQANTIISMLIIQHVEFNHCHIRQFHVPLLTSFIGWCSSPPSGPEEV